MDTEQETGASIEFVVPRDLADGFVNNKRECYKFRYSVSESTFHSLYELLWSLKCTIRIDVLFLYLQTGYTSLSWLCRVALEVKAVISAVPDHLEWVFMSV